MSVKCTALINAITNRTSTTQAQPRAGGWSESWLINAGITQAIAGFEAICQSRARLLPGSASIVGQRYQVLGGGSNSNKRVFPGLATTLGDIPQMALACTGQSASSANICKFRIGGIPDARVVEGEYNPSLSYDNDIQNYFRTLATYQVRFRGRILSNPIAPIVSIDVNGNCSVGAPGITLVKSNVVRLLRAKDAFGRPIKGTFTVASVTDAYTFALANWKAGVCTVGKIRLDGFAEFTISAGTFVRGVPVAHKVGRAFFQFRGRASKKR